MEAAAVLAKELGSWDEAANLYKQASKLYVQCQKAQPGADAMYKAARYAIFTSHPLDFDLKSIGRGLLCINTLTFPTFNFHLSCYKIEEH